MQPQTRKPTRAQVQRLSQLWEWFGEKGDADLSAAEYCLHRHTTSGYTYRAAQPGCKVRDLPVVAVRFWKAWGWVIVEDRKMRLTDAGWRALHGIPRRRRKR